MKTIVFFLVGFLLADAGFFALSVQGHSGNIINMSQFKGKKILLVNTASSSKYNKQLDGLQRLQTQYKDSLVIIVFPTNSFGNEPLSDAALSDSARTKGYTLLYASKSDVTGDNANIVYKWLADKQKNGRINVGTGEDYRKILLDNNGMIVGVFASQMDPMDSLMHKTIRMIYK